MMVDGDGTKPVTSVCEVIITVVVVGGAGDMRLHEDICDETTTTTTTTLSNKSPAQFVVLVCVVVFATSVPFDILLTSTQHHHHVVDHLLGVVGRPSPSLLSVFGFVNGLVDTFKTNEMFVFQYLVYSRRTNCRQ